MPSLLPRKTSGRAEEYLQYSKKLTAKGYVSEAQLEADQFAVEKATKELDLAQTKLEVLRTHSRTAKVNELNASILTAEARLESARNSNELELAQEKDIEEQIEKCVIHSPADGEVTYANVNNKGILIAEGEDVRENQIIIQLPNTSPAFGTGKDQRESGGTGKGWHEVPDYH